MGVDEKRLSKMSYQEIDGRVCELDDASLARLINSRSRKIGDSASEVLARRGVRARLIIDAALDGRMTHRDSKVRAINFLTCLGKRCPEAAKAYLHLLNDRGKDVAGCALFGLVFLRDKKHLPKLQERLADLKSDSTLKPIIEKAIVALKRRSPLLYSPYFHDSSNVWELPRWRFWRKRG